MGVGTLTVSVSGSDLKTGMTPEDLQVITELENVDGVVPSISLNGRVSYGNNVQTGMSVSGKNAYYFTANPDMIVQGRALNFTDDDNSTYVCVISQDLVDEFFLGKNPIGETLYVAGLPFTVVGRYKEDSGGGVASIFMGTMLSSLLAGIASIALLVGGIGIMNMMLTTVTERTTEIGLKKALGAVPGQIQSQFLMESFLLSMIGGLTGAVFGLALSFGLCKLLGTSFVFNGGAILLGVGFSAAVGIIFGWAPARKASKLNPIDALRAA